MGEPVDVLGSGGASHMFFCTTLNRSAWALSAVLISVSALPPASSRISSAPAVSSRFTLLASTSARPLPAPRAPAAALSALRAEAAQAEYGPGAADLETDFPRVRCSEWSVRRRPSARLVVAPVRAVNVPRVDCLATPALARSSTGGSDGQVADPGQDRDDRRSDRRRRPTSASCEKLQHRLLDLQIHHLRTGGRVIIGLDGWDAAGKGGLIERIVAGLEPKSAHVWRIGAPTAEEQGRHYLWRFWQRLPAPGNWAIFDRTWYGRVLVERIEGLCSVAAWKRAYREINEFERELADDGVRIVKLLVHVSAEEQKQRMIDRLSKPHKHYKIGLEDFRNIAKRKEYLEAYDDMLETYRHRLRAVARHRDRRQDARAPQRPQDCGRGDRPGREALRANSIPRSPKRPSSCGAGKRRTAATRSDRVSRLCQASAVAVPDPVESEALTPWPSAPRPTAAPRASPPRNATAD